MKKEELLRICRYYKGEDTCPSGHEWHPFVRFWTLERDYVLCDHRKTFSWEGVRYEEAREAYEGPVLAYCRQRFPRFAEFLDANRFDAVLRGMLAYMIVISYHRMPLDADGYEFILDYGK